MLKLQLENGLEWMQQIRNKNKVGLICPKEVFQVAASMKFQFVLLKNMNLAYKTTL